MESSASAKRLILTTLLVAVVALAVLLGYQQLRHKPGDTDRLPTLELVVKLLDSDGKALNAKGSLIASNQEAPAGDEHCPALKGGDIRSPSHASSDQSRPSDCPSVATWFVKKHPIAFTLYFNNGRQFLQWWDNQTQVHSLIDNRFSRGLFFGLINSLKIKADQLKLQGLQGEFLLYLLRDAIAANAELHYDMAHGRRGWVLSFRPQNGNYAQKAVPVMAQLLAGNAYRISRLPEPILEMRIGLQRWFLIEYQHRHYLAQSLEALLNVVDSITPAEKPSNAPLSLVTRAEAFIDKLLPVWTGSGTAEIRLDFDLQDGKLGSLSLPGGPWAKALHDNIFEGVLAGIPHDSFAAVATSLSLAPTMTVADWRQLADRSPTTATANDSKSGLALVWDFDAENPTGSVGIIIANPGTPEASPAYSQYLKNPELGAECGGGSVFLAATSQNLLTRMKEACAKQSLSPLDWHRGTEKQRYLSSQLLTFINPGTGIRQLFLAGGAGNSDDVHEFAPRWKQEYAQAKAAMREDGDKLFSDLPIFSYAGRLADDGTLQLKGRLIKQEVQP